MEKEKKKHRRPLAAERLVAAMFVFVPCSVAPRASEAPWVRCEKFGYDVIVRPSIRGTTGELMRMTVAGETKRESARKSHKQLYSEYQP